MSLFRRFAACRSGATAIEYGLLSSAVGFALATAATLVGAEVAEGYAEVVRELGVVQPASGEGLGEIPRFHGGGEIRR